jgi:hypothetical protein
VPVRSYFDSEPKPAPFPFIAPMLPFGEAQGQKKVCAKLRAEQIIVTERAFLTKQISANPRSDSRGRGIPEHFTEPLAQRLRQTVIESLNVKTGLICFPPIPPKFEMQSFRSDVEGRPALEYLTLSQFINTISEEVCALEQ